MKEILIANKTFDFALSIIDLYIKLKKENEFIISKQVLVPMLKNQLLHNQRKIL